MAADETFDLCDRPYEDKGSSGSAARSPSRASPATVSGSTRRLRRFVESGLYLQVMAILREDQLDETLIPQGVWDSYGSYLNLLRAKLVLRLHLVIVKVILGS